MALHPPPPWHLFGELIIVPALVRPRALGGVMLANYTSGTLVYRELIVFSHATARGMVVSHIYVDDEQSLSGGHEIWGLPKEPATFEYTRTRFVARQEQTLLSASIRRRPGKVPLAIPAPIVSDAGATLGRARIKAAPALVTLDVPLSSPFAHLGLSGTRPGLAGDDLELTMPAPRS
jgi:acetoacetate decarboxylase